MTTGSHSLDILETLRIEKFRVYRYNNTVDYLKSKFVGYGYALIVSYRYIISISLLIRSVRRLSAELISAIIPGPGLGQVTGLLVGTKIRFES
jgi:hypothetical protein